MEEWQTTTTLLKNLREGHEDAWRRLVARFEPAIRSYLRRSCPPDQVEDVERDILAGIFSGIVEKRYESGKGRLRGWIKGIICRQSYLAYRRRTRDSKAKSLHDWEEDWTNEESPVWEQVWQQEITQLAISRVRMIVSPQTFRAFELVVLNDHDPTAVGEVLNMDVRNVRKAKHRVLKILRRIIAEIEDEECADELP